MYNIRKLIYLKYVDKDKCRVNKITNKMENEQNIFKVILLVFIIFFSLNHFYMLNQ